MPETVPLVRQLASHGIMLSPQQHHQLAQYQQLIVQWNKGLNLVAPSTLPDLERRHILDSAQLAAYIPSQPGTILDVGSGAGLPGLILAILCPRHRFALAERIQKKASFLISATHQLGLKNVTVHAGDVADLSGQVFDIITARAVTELAGLLALTRPLLAPEGFWLLLKGEAAEQEINALKNLSELTIDRHPSIVEPAGKVLLIRYRRP